MKNLDLIAITYNKMLRLSHSLDGAMMILSDNQLSDTLVVSDLCGLFKDIERLYEVTNKALIG